MAKPTQPIDEIDELDKILDQAIKPKLKRDLEAYIEIEKFKAYKEGYEDGEKSQQKCKHERVWTDGHCAFCDKFVPDKLKQVKEEK